jgi:hypothetical protein
MQSTIDFVREKYGPLLSFDQVAKLFDRSTDGLRVCINNQSELSIALRGARKKFGRRVYFDAIQIVEIIEADSYES